MASVDEADYIFQLVALHKYLAFLLSLCFC